MGVSKSFLHTQQKNERTNQITRLPKNTTAQIVQQQRAANLTFAYIKMRQLTAPALSYPLWCKLILAAGTCYSLEGPCIVSTPQMALCVTGFALLKPQRAAAAIQGKPSLHRHSFEHASHTTSHGLDQKNVDFSQSLYSSMAGLDLMGRGLLYFLLLYNSLFRRSILTSKTQVLMLSNVWKKKEINEWGVLFQTTAYVYWNENHCLESSLISVWVAYCFLFARNRLNIPAILLQLLSLFTERHFIWHLTQFSDLSEIPCGVYIYFSFTYWCNRIIYFMLSYMCVMNIHDGWWWEVIKGCKTPGKREEKDNWSWKLFLNYLCVTSRRSQTECIHFLFSFFWRSVGGLVVTIPVQ